MSKQKVFTFQLPNGKYLNLILYFFLEIFLSLSPNIRGIRKIHKPTDPQKLQKKNIHKISIKAKYKNGGGLRNIFFLSVLFKSSS